MYCKDLSSYRYLPQCRRRGVLNVGWLDSKHAFERGRQPDWVFDRLLKHLVLPVARTRGLHTCELCPHSVKQPFVLTRGSENITLGSSEVRVISNGGIVFAAPSLIWHYVEAHEYCPPDLFVDALLHGVDPDSCEFVQLLRALDPGFVHPEDLARRSKRGGRRA